MSARRPKSESAIFGLKSAILCAFVALAGCGSTDRIQGKATAAGVTEPAELFLTPMQSSGIQFVTAYDKGVQASTDALGRVKKAMETVLFDPTSAQFSGIRVGRQGAVCGKYNAKNRYGAYVGFMDFVMTADGRVVTNDTSGTDDSSQTLY